jgi:2-keto-4-pentenoate hydratase
MYNLPPKRSSEEVIKYIKEVVPGVEIAYINMAYDI